MKWLGQRLFVVAPLPFRERSDQFPQFLQFLFAKSGRQDKKLDSCRSATRTVCAWPCCPHQKKNEIRWHVWPFCSPCCLETRRLNTSCRAMEIKSKHADTCDLPYSEIYLGFPVRVATSSEPEPASGVLLLKPRRIERSQRSQRSQAKARTAASNGWKILHGTTRHCTAPHEGECGR